METKKIESLIDELVEKANEKANYEFYGIEAAELADDVEKAYQECISLGVPKDIMDAIYESADYCDMEDGGASQQYYAERIATLKKEAIKAA